VRTLVWGLDLASGDRERGKAAVHEGDGTDERGPLVSVRVRGEGAARATRSDRALGPAWAEARRAGRMAILFFFFFLFV